MIDKSPNIGDIAEKTLHGQAGAALRDLLFEALAP
jgi:hypothetical protein